MIDIRNLLKWSYGFERRHHVLVAAAIIGGIDLYLANLYGSVHPVLALFAFASPIAALLALTKSPVAELKTLAIWGFITVFGSGAFKLFVHPHVAPSLTLNQFTTTTPFGVAITVVSVVAMAILIEAAVMLVGKKIWYWRIGGSGGSADTPEERVLTDEEYADFEPIDYTIMILGRFSNIVARHLTRVRFQLG
jgi:hypothetical protein